MLRRCILPLEVAFCTRDNPCVSDMERPVNGWLLICLHDFSGIKRKQAAAAAAMCDG
jgi:hypothetical protein